MHDVSLFGVHHILSAPAGPFASPVVILTSTGQDLALDVPYNYPQPGVAIWQYARGQALTIPDPAQLWIIEHAGELQGYITGLFVGCCMHGARAGIGSNVLSTTARS